MRKNARFEDTLPRQKHVVVLGLGVAGSSIAAELARRGFRVTGIEQFAPLHERGSSHGDTRIFRRVPHEGDVYVTMATASVEGWRAWNGMAGERLFVECGGIDAGPDHSAMVNAAEELSRQYEQPFQIMDGESFNRKHSHFNLPPEWRVVYQPSSGFVRPDATLTFLHKLAREAGARLLHETAVLGIEPSLDEVKVHTAHEVLTCDSLVVAAGSWLPKLLPELNLSLSTERRVIAWFRPEQNESLTDGRFPIYCLDIDGGLYGMPTPDGTIKIGNDKHLRQQIDPDEPAILPGAEDEARIAPCIQRYLRGFVSHPVAMKACIYTISPDRNFIVDRHPAHSNVFVFSCCSGHGFKYAPVYGEIAADLIAGKPRQELEAFRIGRSSAVATRFTE
jgi:sarcosine oxidase